MDHFGGDDSLASDPTNRLNDNHIFTDNDFRAPEGFVSQLEVLERKTFSSTDNQMPSRTSILNRFDPLVDTIDSNDSFISKFQNMALNGMTPESRTRPDISIHNMSNRSLFERTQNESTTLLKFNTPVQQSVPNTRSSDGTDANNCDLLLGNDFHINELTLQEKIIEKDRQIVELQERLNERNADCQRYEEMIGLLHNFNEDIVELAAEVMDNLVADKNELIDKCNDMNAERSQALEDLSNVEKNFYEVHNRYDKARTALEECKLKEDQFKEQIMELMERLEEKEQMYEILKSKAEQKIEDANVYIESARRECESEMIAIKAQLKRSDMKINGLQSQLDQKTHENEELTKMVDELIANVEK